VPLAIASQPPITQQVQEARNRAMNSPIIPSPKSKTDSGAATTSDTRDSSRGPQRFILWRCSMKCRYSSGLTRRARSHRRFNCRLDTDIARFAGPNALLPPLSLSLSNRLLTNDTLRLRHRRLSDAFFPRDIARRCAQGCIEIRERERCERCGAFCMKAATVRLLCPPATANWRLIVIAPRYEQHPRAQDPPRNDAFLSRQVTRANVSRVFLPFA